MNITLRTKAEQTTFEPYAITIEVDSEADHQAVKDLFATSKSVPRVVRDVQGTQFRDRIKEMMKAIYAQLKSFDRDHNIRSSSKDG